MRKLIKTKIGLILALVAGAAWALEYSFILPGVTLATDAGAEYSYANAHFGVIQSKGTFKPGDLIDYTYADGAIAQFTLPKQGSLCTFGRCVWPLTIHFDNGNIPKIIRQPSGKISILRTPDGDRYAAALEAAKAAGFISLDGALAKPIFLPGYSPPIGWLWAGGAVSATLVPQLDHSRGSVNVGPVTVTDPTTGTTVTTSGTVDLVGGGNFTLTIGPNSSGGIGGDLYLGGPGDGSPGGWDDDEIDRGVDPERVITVRAAQSVGSGRVGGIRNPCAANPALCR